ncbi:Gfo/Idh/MocA family protein [Haloferula chungangensis]|uniref:Gfo/Idh/MocA family protein n=1 Tax=Haloferula chungangensis TaxID=1048331 RepID=A0ABW2LAW6_9BACT
MNALPRRRFLQQSLFAAGSTLALVGRGMAAPSEEIHAAVIGLGDRGKLLATQAAAVPGLKITWLIDADESRAKEGLKIAPGAKTGQDMRKALDDKEVDVVIIGTCNHWHCLAAIWACEAGKDVYVEKPLGHNLAEQRRLIEAAEHYNRIVQVGTQQRSDTVQDEIRRFLHEEKGLGEIQYIRANRYGLREPVAKSNGALKIPEGIDYNLWCGPAEKRELHRSRLHYDWHWDWNTGNGEMGNWGVHILDDVRNVGLADKVGLPKRLLVGGGRMLWDDAGETPNVHFAYYDSGSIPVLFDLSNLSIKPGSKASPAYMGTRSGYTVHCEGGRYSGGRGGGAAYDKDNKRIRKFSGNGGKGHMENFIDAVRERKRSILNADVVQGHYSSSWCELANVGYKVGGKYSRDAAMDVNQSKAEWAELVDQANERLVLHGISLDDPGIALSPVMDLDSASERFTGDIGEKANAYLSRSYREGFELPKIG